MLFIAHKLNNKNYNKISLVFKDNQCIILILFIVIISKKEIINNHEN